MSRNVRQPWVTKAILKKMRQRDRARVKANSTKKQADWSRYRKLQKKVKYDIVQSHNKYLEGIFEEQDTKQLTKRTWAYIRAQGKDSTGIPPLIGQDGKTSETAEDKANTLADQYQSVFTLEDTTEIPQKDNPLPAMAEITITTKGVQKLFEKLNPKKAIGPDMVPTTILKDHADILAPVVREIFQQSLDTGEVPEEWRLANIVAIFKKGDKHVPGNYRPVSLTSVSCKALEHIIYSNIMDHYDRYKFLVKHQHGFRAGFSCETQLLTTTEDLIRGFDQGVQHDIIILDFQKAFDKVPH